MDASTVISLAAIAVSLSSLYWTAKANYYRRKLQDLKDQEAAR